MKQQSNAAGRKFFFMIAAQIMFQVKTADGEEGAAVHSAYINAVVNNDKDLVPTAILGKAQQAVQLQFFKKLGDDSTTVNVVDVVIMTIMNLGYMTEEEFHAAPEGTKQQEVAKTGLSLVQ